MYYKKSTSPSLNYCPGMGWPSYRDISIEQISNKVHQCVSAYNDENINTDDGVPSVRNDRSSYKRPINSAMPGDDYTMPSTPNYPIYDKIKYNNGSSVDKDENMRRRDTRIVKALYTAINETLLPYIEAVIDEYEYIGSPLYEDDGIDRETLSQLIDRVLLLSAADIDEIEEIQTEDNIRTEWNRKQLLKNAAESLLLNEIYAVRRPKYRRIKDNFVYTSGMYDGIARR